MSKLSTLMKIRRKYLYKNKLNFCCYYFCIPFLLMAISGFTIENFFLSIDNQKPLITGEGFLLNQNKTQNYSYIIKYLDNISLSVENKDDCNSLREFIKYETDMEMSCNNSEKNASLIYENENNKHRFKLTGSIVFFMRMFNCSSNHLFADNIIDIFNTNYFRLVKESKNFTKAYNIFLEFQSLLSNYLILQKTNSISNKTIKITTGHNAYPPYRAVFPYFDFQFDKDKIIITFTILISLLFSFNHYFFIVRMIDEKEKKLNILLKNNGISTFTYYIT